MVRIYLDPITDKITGYNKAINELDKMDKDAVFVDGEEESRFMEEFAGGKLYYRDGCVQVIEDAGAAQTDTELAAVEESYRKAKKSVNDEQKIFMDAILDGMSMDEAAQKARENREALKLAEEAFSEALNARERIRKERILAKLQDEEAGIDYKYYMSILLLVRDENEYLEEWLEHFIGLGIDHVYIYDNESEIPVKEFLGASQYLDRVTVIDWPTTENTQEDANNHFLQNYGKETRWVAPMDADEFLQLNGEKSLREYLQENEEYASVLCQWKHYNADGQAKKTEGTVKERFTRQADWYDWEPSGKMFIQTNRVNRFVRYSPVLRDGCRELSGSSEQMQLNHYITKSLEEWKEKMDRGSCDPNVLRNYRLFFKLNPDMAELDTGEDYEQGYGPAKEEQTEAENGMEEHIAGGESSMIKEERTVKA